LLKVIDDDDDDDDGVSIQSCMGPHVGEKTYPCLALLTADVTDEGARGHDSRAELGSILLPRAPCTFLNIEIRDLACREQLMNSDRQLKTMNAYEATFD